ncbi:MAG: carbonic anhydrase [Chlorobi bacterium]|nr:carbonic anhydrase [Chlorobiota bacterium]
MSLHKNIQEVLTPDQVIELLKKGNERFVNDDLRNVKTHHVLELTKEAQYPLAAILACMDSRVPVERIFDKTIGELFSFRSPGNVVNQDIIGGMEYAAKVAGTKLFVVMGHTGCGAVNAAVKGIKLGNLTYSLDKIKPAIERTKNITPKTIDNINYINAVIDNNTLTSIETIRKESEILRNMEENGDIKIVAAMYNIATGRVSFH